MKVTDVRATLLDVPYPVDFTAAWTPHITLSSRPVSLVRIETDDGLVGYGASGRDEAQEVNEIVAPRLIGEDPLAIERFADLITQGGGRWLVDMALWDIVGKSAGKPLHQLWGTYQTRIMAYASTVAASTPEQRADDALRYLEQGFKAIKLRTHYPTMAEDVRLVELVRDAVGERMEIMVDANQAGAPSSAAGTLGDPVRWDYDRALRSAREFEQLGVFWLEEPLPRYQFENLARLCNSVDMNIAGGEGNSGIHEFYWMLRDGVYDIVQPDCTMSESLTSLRKIAAMAEMMDKLFIPHHGNTGIGLAAHMQLCATLRNCPYVELILDPPYRTIESYQQLFGIVATPMKIDYDGYLAVPDGPGLGVEIDEDLIEIYAV